ncbi:MAG TPA: hypothetical protein VJW94_17130 [Candidatus Acidoferrum sp.]|nr:hypothetical protein [Candidatus Acidoferrum sp.]
MRVSSLSSPKSIQVGLRITCCIALVAASVALTTANEPFLDKPSSEWTETEALQVLNDSPWAQTITTSTQDFQCEYEHPAYPETLETYTHESAERMDSIDLTPPAVAVKPDGAEYLVRLVSVKPMQAAVERLISLDPTKWGHYDGGLALEPGSKPTNLAERWYNPADEITIVVVLKRPGPGGASFHDCAFPRKNVSGSGLPHLWPCAAVKTANGVRTAVIGGPAVHQDGAPFDDIPLSFPSTIKGKPLISHQNEKVEFRFIASQRVFEATFYVNPTDLFDGTETVLRIPSTVDKPTPAPLP